MGRSICKADRFLGLEPSPPQVQPSDIHTGCSLCSVHPSPTSLLLPSPVLLQRLWGRAPGALKPPWAGASDQPEWPAVWEGRRASLAGRGLRALLLSA